MVESWHPICSFLATNGYKGCKSCFKYIFDCRSGENYDEVTHLSLFAVQTLPFCKLKRPRGEKKAEAGGEEEEEA